MGALPETQLERKKWLKKARTNPKVGALEHLRLSSMFFCVLLYCIPRSKKDKILHGRIRRTERTVERNLDIRSLIELRSMV